jgi:hypothetical protein
MVRNERIAKIIGGVVLLGTPQPQSGSLADMEKLQLLLRTSTTLSKKALYDSAHQAQLIAIESDRFRGCDQKFPILSVFETKPTKTKRSLFSAKRDIVSLIQRNHIART